MVQGYDWTIDDTYAAQNMCPYETVRVILYRAQCLDIPLTRLASLPWHPSLRTLGNGELIKDSQVAYGFSRFCDLFTYEEWIGFSYSIDLFFSGVSGFQSQTGVSTKLNTIHGPQDAGCDAAKDAGAGELMQINTKTAGRRHRIPTGSDGKA